MSTRLTQKGTPMVDSLALQLVLATAQVQDMASVTLGAGITQW